MEKGLYYSVTVCSYAVTFLPGIQHARDLNLCSAQEEVASSTKWRFFSREHEGIERPTSLLTLVWYSV